MGLLGRMAPRAQGRQVRRRRRRRPGIVHAIAVAAGIAMFGIVFMYTGDADLLMAVSSGLVTSAIFLLLIQFAAAFRRSSG